MKCTACSKDIMKKDVLFTGERLPYCANPMTCSEEHPNSVKNIVERLGAVEMFTEDQLEHNAFENLDVSPEMKERILKVSSKPQSIRLSRIDQAQYILKLQEVKGFSSIAESVRYCIDLAMQVEPIDAAAEKLPVPEPLKLGGNTITIPVVPASVNVNWDEMGKNNEPLVLGESKNTVEKPQEEKFVF